MNHALSYLHEELLKVTLTVHYFSRSKYLHLLCTADITIYLILDNELDREIDVTAMQFLLVQNRQQIHG